MDANGNIIPMVEDDQGEGIMDPLDDHVIDLERKAEELLKELTTGEELKDIIEPLNYDKQKEEILKELSKADLAQKGSPPQPKPHKMLMQVGMSIHFYGFEYVVTKIMKRGRVMLKLMGELPDEDS